MDRALGYLSLLVAVVLAAMPSAFRVAGFDGVPLVTGTLDVLVVKTLSATAIVVGLSGLYRLVSSALAARTPSKRRQHDMRNVLRLVFGVAAVIGVFGVVTEQWVGVLFSLGVVGFAVTFALQQPLFSLIGWFYIMVKRPYAVGDRIAIDDATGDVMSVDFFVTTIWEINGPLVSSSQPSGRVITVPNSVVLSSHVYNYSWADFPYVWNEIPFQVAYETELDFARELLITEAEDYLGAEMRTRIQQYRERLSETPIELEVRDGPTVNVVQQESWVELRLRYLVHPKRGQRMKNELYERILASFNEHPDRVKFPVSRNR